MSSSPVDLDEWTPCAVCGDETRTALPGDADELEHDPLGLAPLVDHTVVTQDAPVPLCAKHQGVDWLQAVLDAHTDIGGSR